MSKIACKGDKLQVSISAVYTDVPQTTSIKGPSPKVQSFDGTALDSGVGMEHKVTGYTDGGTVSVSMFFDPANAVHKFCLTSATTPAITLWKRLFSDGATTTWPFSAIITSPPSPSASVNAGLMADMELTLDGIVTYP